MACTRAARGHADCLPFEGTLSREVFITSVRLNAVQNSEGISLKHALSTNSCGVHVYEQLWCSTAANVAQFSSGLCKTRGHAQPSRFLRSRNTAYWVPGLTQAMGRLSLLSESSASAHTHSLPQQIPAESEVLRFILIVGEASFSAKVANGSQLTSTIRVSPFCVARDAHIRACVRMCAYVRVHMGVLVCFVACVQEISCACVRSVFLFHVACACECDLFATMASEVEYKKFNSSPRLRYRQRVGSRGQGLGQYNGDQVM